MEKLILPGATTAELQEQVETSNASLEAKLEDLVRETNQFTYVITHDLQAPLRMVTGFLELLEKKYAESLDDTARQYISYAVKGSIKMKSLIFDLLEYSRLSSVTYEFGPVDLQNVIHNVQKNLEEKISLSAAQINVGVLPEVVGNEKLLTQLFEHLLKNAICFRKDETPRVDIEAVLIKGIWNIRLRDNGIGIDPAFFEKIFVVFRKLHNDEDKYGGTGIGLPICKKIAELHKGSISVQSVPGVGSTFSLSIPASI